MFKRNVAIILMVILMQCIFYPFAIADATLPPELPAEINPEISDRAKKAGIDTTGLPNPDIKIKLLEAWNAEFREKAQKYGIDTTNLSDEQVREQVLTIENAEAITKAKTAGIRTDGLTYSKVMAAIEEWDRENARIRFGINTEGLTP